MSRFRGSKVNGDEDGVVSVVHTSKHARPAGATYLDKPSGGAAIVEAAAAVSLAGEVDRIYTNTP